MDLSMARQVKNSLLTIRRDNESVHINSEVNNLMHRVIDQYVQRLPRYLSAVGLGAVAIMIWMATAHADPQIAAQNQMVSDDGRIYLHPDQKFSVFVPADAEILESEGAVDLVMQSRLGWVINIQSSPANPVLKLEQMVGRFEAKYVGPGKTWTQKLSEKFLNESSYSGLYEGSGTRTQMVIERTPLWDFVLTFTAPSDAFARMTDVFHRTLASFRPMTQNNSQSTISNSRDSQAAIDGSMEAPPSGQLSRYRDMALGYAISYPANWVVSKPDEFTRVFSGVSGSEAGYVGVSIRNVTASGSAPPQDRAEGMLQQLKAQMAYTDAGIRHERTVEITLGQGDQKAQGMQMVSTFRRGDLDYRQWSIVVPRPGGNVVHVWTYTAPLDRFHKYQEVAEEMAGSMEFILVSPQ